ncbi:MAG: hypothetical protein M5U14_07050 [Acidimicrobiia bacterium]|nr:hypothetical protein [Acidimicrobiia bacterium]
MSGRLFDRPFAERCSNEFLLGLWREAGEAGGFLVLGRLERGSQRERGWLTLCAVECWPAVIVWPRLTWATVEASFRPCLSGEGLAVVESLAAAHNVGRGELVVSDRRVVLGGVRVEDAPRVARRLVRLGGSP